MTDELLALLEDGPHSSEELATWLQQPRVAVVHQLGAMQQERLVKRVGTAKRWALSGYQPPLGRRPRQAPPAPTPPERVAPPIARPTGPELPDVESLELDLEELPSEDLPDDDLLEEAPPETPDRQVHEHLAHAPRRRPVERPAVERIRPDAALSFWVNCDREELNRRIAARQDEMRNSKAARWIDGTVRDR